MANKCFLTGWILTLALAVVVGGCDSSADTGNRPSMDQLAQTASAQRAAEQEKQQQAEAERKAQEEAQAAAQQPTASPQTRAGRPGVGEGGYFTAIIGARRHVLNEAERWPWLQAVQHFQAEHGRLPKDHKEFMNKIVKPLEINLGYIEEGQEFYYDPNEGEWGELYVVEIVQEPAEEQANAAAPSVN